MRAIGLLCTYHVRINSHVSCVRREQALVRRVKRAIGFVHPIMAVHVRCWRAPRLQLLPSLACWRVVLLLLFHRHLTLHKHRLHHRSATSIPASSSSPLSLPLLRGALTSV